MQNARERKKSNFTIVPFVQIHYTLNNKKITCPAKMSDCSGSHRHEQGMSLMVGSKLDGNVDQKPVAHFVTPRRSSVTNFTLLTNAAIRANLENIVVESD
jgi:hypothetical protein